MDESVTDRSEAGTADDAATQAAAPATLRGQLPRAVEETLATLPAKPGCYLFKDAGGTVLYVGKAGSLRDRVRSYFRNPGSLSLKNRGLVPRIASIDYQIVSSETEALLLEFNLVKMYRPRYNIVLTDDKSYLSIRITNEPYPRIETVRRRSDDGARYFGPYPSAQSVHHTLDVLKKLFPYRSCRLNIVPPSEGAGDSAAPELGVQAAPGSLRRGTRARDRDHSAARTVNAKGQKPPRERILTVAGPQNRACLEYHIHRCTAPCIDAISQEDYGTIIDQAALFLQGKSEQVVARLERSMEEAAEALDFERAARLRDQLEAVRRVTERQRVTMPGGHDQDIVGLARADDETCVELIAVREGRMLGHKQFVLKGTADQDDSAVVGAFLSQFYLGADDLPEELLLPAEPEDGEALGQLLSSKRGRKIALLAPRRGDKLALVEMAQKNAQESAEQRKLKWLNDSQKTTQALAELQGALNLPRLPIRIECYDISTIQGTSTVGSMVVFENGKPKTVAYRRFRIRTVTGTDDFASMAEMVRRRLKRAGAATDGRTTPLSSDDETAGSEPVEESLREHTQPAYEDVADETLEEMLQDAPLDLNATAVGDDEPVDVMALRDAGAEQLVDGAGQATTDDADGRTTGGDSEWTRQPDLMIIDGGKGQLNAVLAVLEELGIADQPIVSLAKQHEELFLPGRSDSIVLPANSQALFLVQRIRDEAHRFAITYHRNVRGKRSLESRLDSVPGVGGRRKRDLLRHFGSVTALRKAGVEEIAALPGIGPKTALAIKEYLGDA